MIPTYREQLHSLRLGRARDAVADLLIRRDHLAGQIARSVPWREMETEMAQFAVLHRAWRTHYREAGPTL